MPSINLRRIIDDLLAKQQQQKEREMSILTGLGSSLPYGVAQGASHGHAVGISGPVGQSGLGGGGGVLGSPGAPWAAQMPSINPAPFWCLGEPDLLAMLCMRMRWGIYSPELRQAGTEKAKFTRLMVCQVEDDAVVVACNDGQAPVVIVDPMKLFPSDALITQIRLLEG